MRPSYASGDDRSAVRTATGQIHRERLLSAVLRDATARARLISR
jgi:hypothetical protein